MANPTFATTILRWYREHGRSLPWRETTDPYAIWLSEVILQQTRISQGEAYWQRFIRRFPTVESLAAATEDEVLKLWQGLGYYSRARNLHHAARQIVALGHFPDTLETIRQLKGVGDYTAAAIASLAFGQPAAVLDGNVYRLLSRHFGIPTPINTTRGRREFSALAGALLPPQEAAAYNQGMMDFGALQCVPQSPRCPSCPLQETCQAFRTGLVAELPKKEKKLRVQTRHLTYVLIRCQGFVAMHQRNASDIWQGLWEPYNASHHDTERTETIGEIARQLQMEDPSRGLTLVAEGVRHVLTHRILMADFYVLDATRRPPLPTDYQWIAQQQLHLLAIPRLVELLLARLER